MTVSVTEPAVPFVADLSRAVQVAGLGKTIDDKRVLADITFDVRRGDYVALLGANGAGKSTLLKILATLIPATKGHLALFGETLKGEAAGLRARLGLIGHGAMLYRDLSARENLVFFGRLYDVPDTASRADDLLDYVGLAGRARDPVKTFSRGMAQRVSIARALVHDPDLLLADEPFAGLDAPSQRMLEEMLGKLHGEGKTIVLASHDLAQSLGLAQRALVLRQGRLVVDEETARLDAAAVLAEVTGP
ncbi:MAG: ABC transporter ATP-binding protein [Planctomycetota bacterium]